MRGLGLFGPLLVIVWTAVCSAQQLDYDVGNVSLQLPDPSQMLAEPLNCSGWQEPRAYFEAQHWYTPPGQEPDLAGARVHIGACVPYMRPVSGILPFDVLVQLHNVRDRNITSVEIFTPGPLGATLDQQPLGLTCTDADACRTITRLYADTTQAGADGVVSLHFRPLEERTAPPPPGLELSFGVELAVPVRLTNGGAVSAEPGDAPANASGSASGVWRAHGASAWGPLPGAAPLAPAGTVLPRLATWVTSGAANASAAWVAVDANPSGSPPSGGRLLSTAPGSLDLRALALNPAALGLAPGLHSVSVRSESYVPQGPLPRSSFDKQHPFAGGTSTVVLLFGFIVEP